MTALFQRIILICGLFTCYVFSKESEPYLTIMVNNLPLLANTIEVYNGQNVYVECIAHPSYYSALWLSKDKYSKQVAPIEDKQIIDDLISSNIATLNLTDSKTGIYICQSIPTKLEKSINVVAKKRIKRDDEPFHLSFPEGRLPTVEETLRMQQEFLERYKLDEQKQAKDMEDTQYEAERKRAEDEINAKERKSVNRAIGITVGLLIIGGVLVAVFCMLSRRSNRKPPTPIAALSVPPRATGEQLQPLNSQTAQSTYRPIGTYIPPYPPISVAVRPTAPTAVELETLPPPSYDEALNNIRPTAPIIST